MAGIIVLISMTLEKSAIFIDGGYLNQVLKKHFKEKDIDFLRLCENVSAITETKRLRTYYYHCLPLQRKDNAEDTRRIQNLEKFLTKLRRLPRCEVKLGRLQLIGGFFKQKMVDILMSLDIVDLCFSNQIQHAILFAGDADFVPAVKRARESGAIIHLFYHPETVHNEILDHADDIHEITKEFIDKCKQQ
jgi:uncharacterized LabA/DUF88 family protein